MSSPDMTAGPLLAPNMSLQEVPEALKSEDTQRQLSGWTSGKKAHLLPSAIELQKVTVSRRLSFASGAHPSKPLAEGHDSMFFPIPLPGLLTGSL